MEVAIPVVSAISTISSSDTQQEIGQSPKRGFCSLFKSNTFLRANQVVAVAIAVCSIASIILMSLHIAPMSSETYAFSIVLAVVCIQNFFVIRRNIELGSFEKQNGIYKAQNERLKQSVKDLSQTVEGLQRVSSDLEKNVRDSRLITERQNEQIQRLQKDIEAFASENSKLIESNARYEGLIKQFDVSLQRFNEGQTAFRETEVKFEESLSQSLKLLEDYKSNEANLKDQVFKLSSVQKALQGTLLTLTTSADAARAYIEKEEKLQKEQEGLVERFRKLAEDEEGFALKESELLTRLDRDVRILQDIVEEKKQRCVTLARRVLPLSLEVSRLEVMMEYIKSKNGGLFHEASNMSKEERKKTFLSLRAQIRV
jgi:hypothetical protein